MYLRSSGDRSPSLNDLTIDQVVAWDIHNPDDLSVGVVFVPHIENEAVRLVADLHLERFVPLWVEAVVDHPGLGDPALAQLHVHEGVGDILGVVQLAVPILHVRNIPEIFKHFIN